jgi:hypothetical protein
MDEGVQVASCQVSRRIGMEVRRQGKAIRGKKAGKARKGGGDTETICALDRFLTESFADPIMVRKCINEQIKK